ncbi:MAG: ArsA family ATPase, partial [Prochloraceae cyanobacterium]
PEDLTSESTKEASQMLERGKEAVADPQRVIAYLVTTAEQIAIAKAQYLWGSAQQIGLTVGGVLLNQDSDSSSLANEFQPLPLTSLPTIEQDNWQPLIDALPSFTPATSIPQPISIEIRENKIKVFLPGFDKKQVKLTQYGPEITIEAGDQRRNIIMPPQWTGRSVTGAKFNKKYLELSIG